MNTSNVREPPYRRLSAPRYIFRRLRHGLNSADHFLDAQLARIFILQALQTDAPVGAS
jgi:hypothetical protein